MKNILTILAISMLTFSCKAEAPTTDKISSAVVIKQTGNTQQTKVETPAPEDEPDIKPVQEEIPEKTPTPIITPKIIPDNNITKTPAETNVIKQEVVAKVQDPIEVSKKKEVTKGIELIEEESEEVSKTTSEPEKSIEFIKEDVSTTIIEEVATPIAIHDQWNQLLTTYVSSGGKVDYAGLKSQISTLDGYLADLSKNVPSESDLSASAKAFWMNAYNAFTVKLILNNYPLGSITDLHGGKPWDQKWIKLGSKTYSLNNIEHDILRPKFKDGRVHFAVNCAAKSCPKLSNKAFTVSNSEQLLNSLTKTFVNNTAANTIGNDSVEISKIFDWYGVDFGDLIGFLNKYATTKIAPNAAISFKDYNWALNSK